MVIKNSLNFAYSFFYYFSDKIRNLYLYSSIYNKKISTIDENVLIYKPSPMLLSCLIKYDKKKYNIEDFSLNSIWSNNKINKNDYKKLHNFFWLFALDLKSSKKITQSIILNWIEKNKNYNSNNWEVDTLSKRVIAWIANSKLTYEGSTIEYKKKYNLIIKKQINHLIHEMERTDAFDDKMIGSAAIILSGLSFKNERFLSYGLKILQKIIKYSFDKEGFTKSRSFRQLVFYLKYFILIRELLKESINEIPEYLDETIFYLGKFYSHIWQSTKSSLLFNGNQEYDHKDFDNYLKIRGYKFKSEFKESGGYIVLNKKKILLAMDVGCAPEKKFSKNYQSGALSFELLFEGEKLITNCGYFQNLNHQLNRISKSTAAHSTLVIDNNSINKFYKNNNKEYLVEKNFKILNKKILLDNNTWKIYASHNGYQKRYGIIHQREIVCDYNNYRIVGNDKLIKNKNHKKSNFEIRFHLSPKARVTKTQDGKSILIEIAKSGWKFICFEHEINIERGLYFGEKNLYTENQNILISGITRSEDQTVNWEISKI